MAPIEAHMKRMLRILLGDDAGQDLIEYTLLIAFVALTTAGLFLGSGANVNQAWSSANSVLTTASDGQSPPANTGGGSGGQGGDGGDGGMAAMAATTNWQLRLIKFALGGRLPTTSLQ